MATLHRRRLSLQSIGSTFSELPFAEQTKLLRTSQKNWILFGIIAFLIVLGLAITAFFFPLHNNGGANEFTCSGNNTINETCLPEDVSFNSINITQSTILYENITILGNLYCETPIWPSCLDISGQACEYPLQQSCMPTHVDTWNVTGPLILTGNTSELVCDHPLGASCIGTNLTLDSLTVTHLTVLNTTEMVITYYEQLTLNNTVQVGPFTCSGNGSVSPNCIDISGEVCTSPVADECMQPRIKTLNGISPTASPALNFDLLAGQNVAIVGGVNSLTISSSIPETISVTNITITGLLTCVGEASFISPSCIDISGKNCTSPLSNDCMQPRIKTVNGISPTALPALDFSVLAGNKIAIINGPNNIIVASTDDISNGTCLTPVSPSCIPANLTLHTLTLDHLFVNNMTIVEIAMQNVEMFMSNNTIQKGPFTCQGSGFVDPDCIDISGEMCTSPIADSCAPLRIKSVNGILPNAGTLDFGILGSSSIAVIPGTNAITLVADISGSNCTSPVSETCLPSKVSTLNGIFSNPLTHNFNLMAGAGMVITPGINQLTLSTNILFPLRVGSVNGILPNAGTFNFNVLAGSNIAVTPAVNGVTISSDISGTACTIPINANCVQIDGETCLAPISDSCMQTRVKTINGIAPTASPALNFNINAGVGIAVTPSANAITISASDPLIAACVFDDFVFWDTSFGGGGNILHASTVNWFSDLTGGGSSVQPTSVGVNNIVGNRALGVLDMTAGSSVNHRAAISVSTQGILFGFAKITFIARVRAKDLMINNLQTYNYYAGFLDVFAVITEPVDGVYFKIDRTISTTNWLLITRSNSIQTVVNTGIAVITTAFQKLQIDVNEPGTLVTASIDGVATPSISINIPTASGRDTGIGFKIIQTAGNQQWSFYVDFVQWCTLYSSPR